MELLRQRITIKAALLVEDCLANHGQSVGEETVRDLILDSLIDQVEQVTLKGLGVQEPPKAEKEQGSVSWPGDDGEIITHYFDL